MQDRKADEPFCYWHGGQDPHRPYELNVGVTSGIKLSEVKVPACLPDNETVRSDVADYLWEVQRFDREVGEIVARLKAMGELDNTIIVVSGDNGMPFPRCKATLYDQGTRVPLAIRWGEKIQKGRKVTDFVNLCDLAPTFLEAAGLHPPSQMTGQTLMPIFNSKKSGQIDPLRTFVLTGMERHVYQYPARALRTKDFLYLHNFDPQKWPTGEVEGHHPKYNFLTEPWPVEKGAFSFNIDPSPSKQFLRLHRDETETRKYSQLSFLRHPAEELYDLRNDPHQLVNVAGVSGYTQTRKQLRQKLTAELIKTNDPRVAVPGYISRSIEGWPVRVSKKLTNDRPQDTARTIELLAEQLRKVRDSLPSKALSYLRSVPIWLSPQYEGVRPTAEYHSSAKWLKKNGRHPDLLRCVELTNIAIFEREVQRMPMMVLHELAHAFHDQILSFDHTGVKKAYDNAAKSGIYNAVHRNNGKVEKAYAMRNRMEYFAETSEAFFGINDFYPHNRSELEQHDPKIVELLERLWQRNIENLP
ncbi:MAG: sulfatase-like hydrolase/transferase [Gimesia sp.]|nr:sulfatase-like hydrolase/transferase [Gimesia sp.]